MNEEQQSYPWHPTPSVVREVAERWSLAGWDPTPHGRHLEDRGFVPEEQLPNARFSVVVRGTFLGKPAVAKLSADPSPTAALHCSWMLASAGASPAVYHLDRKRGAMVMEFLGDAKTLGEMEWAEPRELASLFEALRGLPSRLHAGPLLRAQELHSFLEARLSGGASGDVARSSHKPTAEAVEKARETLTSLPRDERLVHGDLSAGNLLYSSGRWWAIDPRPLFGDWHYDLAVLCWKGCLSPHRREDLMKLLGADRTRVEAWELVARAARV